MIYKFTNDYTNNYCTPLYFYQNEFTENRGCARSMGMVSVQCFFNDILKGGTIPKEEGLIFFNDESKNP